jgi:uncharacterized protein
LVVKVFYVNFANFILRQKVNHFKQFILSIRDLPIGNHNYEFKIEDWFFDNFEYSEIKKGKLKVALDLEKQERMYILHFLIDGYANVICDRCGDYFEQPLKGEQNLILKTGNVNSENDIDLAVINEQEQHFEITQYLYEYISLLLPMHRVHPLDKKGHNKCNKQALELLEKFKIKHSNKVEETDSRWDELKKLKFN